MKPKMMKNLAAVSMAILMTGISCDSILQPSETANISISASAATRTRTDDRIMEHSGTIEGGRWEIWKITTYNPFDETRYLYVESDDSNGRKMGDFTPENSQISNAPWLTYKSQISKIFIKGFTYIGKNAFRGLTEVKDVDGLDSVKQFGTWAFEDTKWLTNLRTQAQEKDAGLVIINNNILLDGMMCEGTANIPSNVKTIARGAFFTNGKLKKVVIPNTVTEIGEDAFRDCESLQNVNIPNNVKIIEPYTFNGCDKLESIKLHDKITTIGMNAFGSCDDLKFIIWTDQSGTAISKFTNCALKLIDKSAFESCGQLRSVYIPNNPNSETEIKQMAFGNCDRLEDITIFCKKLKLSEEAFGQRSATDARFVFVYPDAIIKNPNNRPYVPGDYEFTNIADIDQNWMINAGDAQKQLEIVSDELAGVPNEYAYRAVDFNKDQNITSLEAQYILLYFLENVVNGSNLTWHDIMG